MFSAVPSCLGSDSDNWSGSVDVIQTSVCSYLNQTISQTFTKNKEHHWCEHQWCFSISQPKATFTSVNIWREWNIILTQEELRAEDALRTIKPFMKFPFVLTSQLFYVVIKSFEGDQNALFRDFSCVIRTDRATNKSAKQKETFILWHSEWVFFSNMD